MSATYGTLRSDKTQTSATKSGNAWTAAESKTWKTAAEVTVWKDGRVILEIRDIDSGRVLVGLETTAEGIAPLTVNVRARVDGRLVELPPFTVDRS